MKSVVVDASTALAWGIPDEQNDYADEVLAALRDHVLLVPAIWPLEVSNALVVAERRGRLTKTDTQEFAESLDTLSTRIHAHTISETTRSVLPLARVHQLSAYDASYLELAMRQEAPLATLDKRLRQVAPKEGVPLSGQD